MSKKINIQINDENSYRLLLQESYNDAILLINEASRHISILENSTELKDAILEEKTKYTKAMTDLLKEKSNAIKLKISVANQLQNALTKLNKVKKNDGESDEETSSDGNFAEVLNAIKNQKNGDIKNGGSYKGM